MNGTYAFSFKYPPDATTDGLTDSGGRLYLPVAPGTNLGKKWLDVSVVEGVSPCKSPGSNPMAPTENVTFNGIQFLKETWEEGVTSHRVDITAYSRAKGNACISLNFLLWSVVPEVLRDPSAASLTAPPNRPSSRRSCQPTQISRPLTAGGTRQQAGRATRPPRGLHSREDASGTAPPKSWQGYMRGTARPDAGTMFTAGYRLLPAIKKVSIPCGK